MKKVSSAILLSTLFITYLSAQPSRDSISNYINSGEFAALEYFPHSTKSRDSVNNLSISTYNNYFGRPELNPPEESLPSAMPCAITPKIHTDPAIWISQNIQNSKVIMFNESHMSLAQRVFVRQQLKYLKDLGFTHLGIEAIPEFNETIEAEEIIKYGQYTLEPTFSALIREGIELGFELVAYENRELAPESLVTLREHISFREQGQAENLALAITNAPADSKFVIYTGWSHIAEVPIISQGRSEKIKWLAARLKDLTGIDPLTIDLTLCTYEPEGINDTNGRIYFSDSGEPLVQGIYAEAVDVQVFLPKPSGKDEEARQLMRSSLGSEFYLPRSLRSDKEPFLVQARILSAGVDSVAWDRVIMSPSEDIPLFLKPGDYEIKSYKGDGNVIGIAVVNIRE